MGKFDTSVFYSFARILSYNAFWMFIVGGRGIGKSYGGKKKIIKDAIKKGHEFIYLRRYKDELKEARNTFFDDVAGEFPQYDFRVMGSVAQYAEALPVDFETLEPGEQKKLMKDREWFTIGYFKVLSTSQQAKSTAYPRVHNILFDEFIIEKGNVQYLANEVVVMLNFYSTVDRYNDRVKVFFLANSVMIDNPYFIEFGIDPDQATNGMIVKNNGYIAVEFPDSTDFNNEVYKTRFGGFITEASPEYADFAISNQFRDNHKLMLEGKDFKADYLFSLETAKGTFSVWAKMFDPLMYIQAKRPRGGETVYTTVPNKMSEEKTFVEHNHKLLQGLRVAWRHGNMRFDSAQTRNAMLEIFIRR